MMFGMFFLLYVVIGIIALSIGTLMLIVYSPRAYLAKLLKARVMTILVFLTLLSHFQ